MERVMIVEDHLAFAQALELILGQVEVALANLFPQTPRRIRQLASRAADTGSARSLPRRTNWSSATIPLLLARPAFPRRLAVDAQA